MRTAFVVQLDRPRALRALNFSATIEAIKRRGVRHYTPLLDLTTEMGVAYRNAFPRQDADPSVAVQLMSQSEMFAAEPSGRCIRLDSFTRPERHAIHRWQLLIAGVGTLGETELFGRSLIADERLVGKYMSEDVFALTFKEPEGDASLYAAAFLATRVGVWAVRSTAYGTKTLKLNREMMAELPVPRTSRKVEQRIADLMRDTVTQRETYIRELQAARNVLAVLPVMREAHDMCAERRARHVLWNGPLFTLNAWNYASMGGALELLLRCWPGRLRDVVPTDKIFRGIRIQRISCEAPYGVDFLNQRDAFSIRPIPRRIVQPAIDRGSVYVPAFSLLVGGQGTLGEGELFGQVALVTADLAKNGITEHLLRLQPLEREHAAVCYAFLSTLVGRRLLRSTGVGTKLLSLREDLVLALPYPTLTAPQTHRILTHLEAASLARTTAANAETEAIRIIEEEVLPAWLA